MDSITAALASSLLIPTSHTSQSCVYRIHCSHGGRTVFWQPTTGDEDLLVNSKHYCRLSVHHAVISATLRTQCTVLTLFATAAPNRAYVNTLFLRVGVITGSMIILRLLITILLRDNIY